MQIATSFPRYEEHAPSVPVYCVTPDLPGAIHRFYDTSPFSPTGRYLAVTQLPSESRLPEPGDVARIAVVDLLSGEHRVVAETRGWDTQLGAQLQWGVDDHSLFFNDLKAGDWRPFGVKMDPETGRSERLQGTVYMISSDGKQIVSPCLRRIARTQSGYGVVVPKEFLPSNRAGSDSDGIYITDAESGACQLLISISDLVSHAELNKRAYRHGDFYLFHVKWNPQGTRLMVVLRWLPQYGGGLAWLPWRLGRQRFLEQLGRLRRDMILTLRPNGSEIRVALPASEWAKGGHHPNWCPDGEQILMNLNVGGEGLRFLLVDYDGNNYRSVGDQLVGSGHPTLHPDGYHILTDAYPSEPVAAGDGTSPIRWIDLRNQSEEAPVRIHIQPDFLGPRQELRVDPHPAWDRSFHRIAFNACPYDGKRRVFVADMTALL